MHRVKADSGFGSTKSLTFDTKSENIVLFFHFLRIYFSFTVASCPLRIQNS